MGQISLFAKADESVQHQGSHYIQLNISSPKQKHQLLSWTWAFMKYGVIRFIGLEKKKRIFFSYKVSDLEQPKPNTQETF